jgi:quinol monooxygenase YgiN
MAASVYVVARFVPKAGKDDELKKVLAAAIAPTRRELGCYQYDVLVGTTEPREYCLIERWEGETSLEQHLNTPHARQMLEDVEDLVSSPPDIRRYRFV